MFNIVKNFNCQLCPLQKHRKNIVNGVGPTNAKIVVVGEAPGLSEDDQGSPGVGPAGRLLKQLLQRAGIDHREIFFTNICRCLPKCFEPKKPVRDPKAEEIEKCAPFLETELLTIKPNVIVPVGNVALKYILGIKSANITSHRGLEIWSDKYNCKICPTLHPGVILRNPKYEGVVVEDLKRIKTSATTKEIVAKSFGTYTTADTIEKVEELFKHLEEATEVAFDIETTGLNWRSSELISISFSWKEREGWSLPLLKAGGSHDRFWDDTTYLLIAGKLGRFFRGPAKKIAHNGRFDIKHLMYHGFDVNNFYFDTLLSHHILDENAENLHGLKDVAWVFTDMGGYDKEINQFFKENKKIKKQFIMLPFDMLHYYGAADADCTFRLFKRFEPMLKEQNLTRLYRQIVMPTSEVLLDAEINGVRADKEYIEKLRQDFTIKRDQLEQEVYKHTGKFNINSPVELRTILFDRLKLKSVKHTLKGAQSTDRETLDTLTKIYPDQAVPKLLAEYREVQKLLNTFIEGLSEHIVDDGRIHSTYKQHGTVTGRLSSAEPNLQNIPRESAIRGIFVPKPGYKLVEADYAAAEFRWWAHYSNDPQMVADIKSGKDIHRMTASSVFNIPIDQVTKAQRQLAKGTVFGLLFGRGIWSIASEFGISEEQAKKIVRTFFGRYPKAEAWLKQQVWSAKQTGQVISHFGRVRRLPGINSSVEMVRSEAERQAMNAPIQGAASDTTCIAAVRIKKRFNSLDLKENKLVLTVHDSLVYEVPDAEVGRSAKIIKEEMLRPIEGVNVPMGIEMKIGDRWGSLVEVKEEVKA